MKVRRGDGPALFVDPLTSPSRFRRTPDQKFVRRSHDFIIIYHELRKYLFAPFPPGTEKCTHGVIAVIIHILQVYMAKRRGASMAGPPHPRVLLKHITSLPGIGTFGTKYIQIF